MVKSLKMKDKKLKVSRSHGFEFQEGAKMTPSASFLTGAKGISGVRGAESPFEFDYIVIDGGFKPHMTSEDHIALSGYHKHEACKKCRKSSCRSCKLLRV